jgi:mannose-6-phosphate isomerase-like protein (cupin superfamily)
MIGIGGKARNTRGSNGCLDCAGVSFVQAARSGARYVETRGERLMRYDDRYEVHTDNKYGYLQLIDIPAEVAAHEPWFNQTLSQVNDCVLRLGILEGDYHWHKHEREDECFIVLDGELFIDLEGRETVCLKRHHGYTIPKGFVHRPRAPQKTVVLMFEGASVTPTGD